MTITFKKIDFGKIHYRKLLWVPLTHKKKAAVTGYGSPIISEDGTKKAVKETNVYCRFKDGEAEGQFITKALCVACENHKNGYCLPLIKEEKDLVREFFSS